MSSKPAEHSSRRPHATVMTVKWPPNDLQLLSRSVKKGGVEGLKEYAAKASEIVSGQRSRVAAILRRHTAAEHQHHEWLGEVIGHDASLGAHPHLTLRLQICRMLDGAEVIGELRRFFKNLLDTHNVTIKGVKGCLPDGTQKGPSSRRRHKAQQPPQ